MSVAKVIELSCTSEKSFEDAIRQGIVKASETIRNIRSAWVKEMRVGVNGNAVSEFQVNLQVTFVLDAGGGASGGSGASGKSGGGKKGG